MQARLLPVARRLPLLRQAATCLDSLAGPEERIWQTLSLARNANRLHCYSLVLTLLKPLEQRGDGLPLAVRQRLYFFLAHAYSALGQWHPAYEAEKRELTINDTLTSQHTQRLLSAFDVQYRTREKEQRIGQLTQQNSLQALLAAQQTTRARWLVAGVLALLAGLAVLVGLYVRLRRSRQALAAATRAKDSLYSLIGHDLRSPLVAFTGLADMLDYYRQRQDLAGLGYLTDEVRRAATRLAALLDNLLHWAATETGELTSRPEPLPLAPLLHEVAALYQPAAQARQVQLTVAVPAALPPALADRNMALTIGRNLLGNALKVAPPGSTITLAAAAAPGHRLSLSVHDQGPGLSAAQVASLLAATPGPAARPGGYARGTGLGLPLVRRLAALQGGQFAFESQPGQGSTARVLLPQA